MTKDENILYLQDKIKEQKNTIKDLKKRIKNLEERLGAETSSWNNCDEPMGR